MSTPYETKPVKHSASNHPTLLLSPCDLEQVTAFAQKPLTGPMSPPGYKMQLPTFPSVSSSLGTGCCPLTLSQASSCTNQWYPLVSRAGEGGLCQGWSLHPSPTKSPDPWTLTQSGVSVAGEQLLYIACGWGQARTHVCSPSKSAGPGGLDPQILGSS